jgi:hypothetical protein
MLNRHKDPSQADKQFLDDNQILKRLKDDGIFVDDPKTKAKFSDTNVQRLEERLLREGKYNYFKLNGEIKLHHDILADQITRPIDLSVETSEGYRVKEVNSLLSNRMHSFKSKRYRLDITLGKIFLSDHPVMSEEERMAI